MGYTPDADTRATLAELYGVAEVRLFAEYHARRAELLAPLDDLDDDGEMIGAGRGRRRAS